jgi:hypothetical protein
MGQVSAKLRRSDGTGDLIHWCPGCESLHVLPIVRGGWTFDGNLSAPTYTPSFLHLWHEGIVEKRCHYILTAGVLHFCDDSSHALRGAVPLPDLPNDESVEAPAAQPNRGDRT